MDKQKKTARSPLGRGLSALISSTPVAVYRSPAVSPGNPRSVIGVGSNPAEPSEGSSQSAIQGNLATKVDYVELAVSQSQIIDHPEEKVINPAGYAGSEAGEVTARSIRYISIAVIDNNPAQPRQIFNAEQLTDLTESIKKRGVLQPVLLRPLSAGRFEIVAGERRWRAAKVAGLEEIPAIVEELSDREALEIAIIENIQRADLNPVEEARAYNRLAIEFNLTQQEIADRVSKERVTVANSLRLLKLHDEVLAMLSNNELSAGHAKVLLSIKDPAAQLSLAKKTVLEGLSVRELEGLVARVTVLDAGKAAIKREKKPTPAQNRNGSISATTDRLREALGTKVRVQHHVSGRGKIVIEYFSEAELERVVEQIIGQGR